MSAPAAAAPLYPASPVIGPSVTPKAIESYLRGPPLVNEVGAVLRFIGWVIRLYKLRLRVRIQWQIAFYVRGR